MAGRAVRLEEGTRFGEMGGEIRRLIHPTTTGSQRLQMSHVRQQPGEAVRRHRHDAEEAYFVLSGSGVLYMDGGDPVALSPGVAVFVPGGVAHHQVNTGEGPLELITALAPPLRPGDIVYVDG